MGRGSGEDNRSGASRNTVGGFSSLKHHASGVFDSLAASMGDRFGMDPQEARKVVIRAGLGSLVGSALVSAPIAAAGGLGYVGYKCLSAWVSSGKADQDGGSIWARALLGRNRHGQVNTPRTAIKQMMGVAAVAALAPIALFSAPLLPALAAGSGAAMASRGAEAWRRVKEEKQQSLTEGPDSAHSGAIDPELIGQMETQAATIGAVIAASGLTAEEAARAAESGEIPMSPQAAASAAAAAADVAESEPDYSDQAPAEAYTQTEPAPAETEVEMTPAERRAANYEEFKRWRAEKSGQAAPVEEGEAPPAAKPQGRTKCVGKTKAGNKCSRWAQPDSRYCHQHQDQDSSYVVGPEGTSGGPEEKELQPADRGSQYVVGPEGEDGMPRDPQSEGRPVDRGSQYVVGPESRDGMPQDVQSDDDHFNKLMSLASVWATEHGSTSANHLRQRLGLKADEAELVLEQMELHGVVTAPDSQGNRLALMDIKQVRGMSFTPSRNPEAESYEFKDLGSPSLGYQTTRRESGLDYQERRPETETQERNQAAFEQLPPASDGDHQRLQDLVERGEAKAVANLMNEKYFTPKERFRAQVGFAERQIKTSAPQIVEGIAANLESAGLGDRAQELRSFSPEQVTNASLDALGEVMESDRREYWKASPGLLTDITTFTVGRVARRAVTPQFSERDLHKVLGPEKAQGLVSRCLREGFDVQAVTQRALEPLCQSGGSSIDRLRKGVRSGDRSLLADYLLGQISKTLDSLND
jgi:hypothetical protein